MVADFGIALAVSAAAGGRMTETGLSLGTPHYMSPEQATAEKEITARSDVYSLGSVLYEMLAGQPPHLGGSAQQIIMKIIAEPVANGDDAAEVGAAERRGRGREVARETSRGSVREREGLPAGTGRSALCGRGGRHDRSDDGRHARSRCARSRRLGRRGLARDRARLEPLRRPRDRPGPRHPLRAFAWERDLGRDVDHHLARRSSDRVGTQCRR